MSIGTAYTLTVSPVLFTVKQKNVADRSAPTGGLDAGGLRRPLLPLWEPLSNLSSLPLITFCLFKSYILKYAPSYILNYTRAPTHVSMDNGWERKQEGQRQYLLVVAGDHTRTREQAEQATSLAY